MKPDTSLCWPEGAEGEVVNGRDGRNSLEQELGVLDGLRIKVGVFFRRPGVKVKRVMGRGEEQTFDSTVGDQRRENVIV